MCETGMLHYYIESNEWKQYRATQQQQKKIKFHVWDKREREKKKKLEENWQRHE